MFMAMPMLYRVAAVLIALAVVAGGWMLYLRERNNFAEYKADVAAAVKAQQDKVNLITKQQNRITKNAEVSHEANLNTIRGTYQRLRDNSSGPVSYVPNPTTDPAQATSYYLDVAPDLATGCAETTQQLVSLQSWINEQQQVNDGR
jgi:hypothetical protein